MSKVEIYTKDYCPFCHRAKALLDEYGVDYIEYDLLERPELRDEMIRRSNGGRTVPQVIIDDQPYGGSDDLAALDRAGALAPLLKLETAG